MESIDSLPHGKVYCKGRVKKTENKLIKDFRKRQLAAPLVHVDLDPLCLSVCLFHGPLVVVVIMIDSSKKHNRKFGFELQSLRVFKRRSNMPTNFIGLYLYKGLIDQARFKI